MITLEITSPTGLIFKGEVESITLPGLEGQFQILNHHAPFISVLTNGEIKVKNQKSDDHSFRISGGIFEINKNQASALIDSIVE